MAQTYFYSICYLKDMKTKKDNSLPVTQNLPEQKKSFNSFQANNPFLYPWKCQKPYGGIEMEQVLIT